MAPSVVRNSTSEISTNQIIESTESASAFAYLSSELKLTSPSRSFAVALLDPSYSATWKPRRLHNFVSKARSEIVNFRLPLFVRIILFPISNAASVLTTDHLN